MEMMREEIKRWVVNDYFTPNIKAEVILDTLLTPYIEELVKNQCGLDGVKFITKEMSIKDDREDKRGKKIDYLLADSRFVYMVELKTTKGSIKKKQWKTYFNYCLGEGRDFGTVFGEKMIEIGSSLTTIPDNIKSPSEKPWNERVEYIFAAMMSKGKAEYSKDRKTAYVAQAKELLKEKGWDSTHKYLYTMGQLLDYYEVSADLDFWKKPLKLIYITPDGDSIVPKSYHLSESEKAIWEEFYISPDHTQNTSIGLKEASSYLREKYKDEEYALLVSEIIEEIYGEIQKE